jgi:DNA (cytosine-5)-methyltransferase 1
LQLQGRRNCRFDIRQVSWIVIPVIDLFAGPGGLGEGFASRLDRQGRRIFRIALSIEMDESARATLKLRSFFRQFHGERVPDEYYQMLEGKLPLTELYKKFPVQAAASDNEAWRAELGKTSTIEIDQRIRTALNNAAHWVLIGGPPCQAYSMVGRSRVINVDREKYEKDRRHFLYREYLRILRVHRPPIFVMENVKGILSSKMKGKLIVEKILTDLESPLADDTECEAAPDPLGYALYPLAEYSESLPFGDIQRLPSDYIIRSELHGIPQARHRFIVLGVHNDIDWKPAKLRNITKPVSVWNAIGDLPRLRSRLSGKGSSSEENDTQAIWASAIREILRQQLNKENGVEPAVRAKILATLRRLQKVGTGGGFVATSKQPGWRRAWFRDARLKGVCNHESRRHRKDDLWRYLFASCFAAVRKKSPTLLDFPPQLLPDHKNLQAIAEKNSELAFADRFRVQVKHRYSTTVTSHIAKDGHYFIHYDPSQCRSLTVREAARLQTFPDNYLFLGGKTEQYRQVGNAVPPLLAAELAAIVSDYFLILAKE